MSAASHLLSAETLLATTEPRLAAHRLKSVISPAVQLPPDLYAEMERVAGNSLAMSGNVELAKVHLERACRTFDFIGHTLGKEKASGGLKAIGTPTGIENGLASAWCLTEFRRSLIYELGQNSLVRKQRYC